MGFPPIAGQAGDGGGLRVPARVDQTLPPSAHTNQVWAALRFVFGITLGRPTVFARIFVAETSERLPIMLSRVKGARLLHAVGGLRNRTAPHHHGLFLSPSSSTSRPVQTLEMCGRSRRGRYEADPKSS
jgi:hypothetical protein